ncbi:MAG: TetR/AcrR family transcriptional regulator [Verrucomicrobiae bacterium]|nr:TetR/AcrR family transcriptional regulator [Verrucomicrobiae bacterium]
MPSKRRKRNAPLTRKAILGAAEKLFAQNGFNGVSMRDLSRLSGISQPLIHHHFGTKEALYQAVKQRAMDQFKTVWPSTGAGRDILGRLQTAARNIFTKLVDDRKLLRLSSWTRLEDGNELWPGEDRMMEQLRGELVAAQKAGELRRDVDPLLMAIMLEALICFWCEERLRLKALFKDWVGVDERYLREMWKVLERGMKVR